MMRAALLAWPLAMLAISPSAPGATTPALWETTPYRVSVAVESRATGLSPRQQAELGDGLRRRLAWRLGGFWKLMDDAENDAIDKRFSLRVVADSLGHRIEANELDVTLGLPSESTMVRVASAADLEERLYAATLAAFRPLALVLRDTESAEGVTLHFRGASLAPKGLSARAAPGTLLLPFRRTLNREGVASSVKPTPWTYLVAAAPDREEGAAEIASAMVVSHTRRPFSARAGARAEFLAIAAPVDLARVTRLRLHALESVATPLVGYEVSLGQPGSMSLEPLGATDASGRVTLPSRTGVWMAHVKCGDLVVASLPVAPGVAEEITLGLVDERSRLRAELEMTSLREELIDTVARRKILAERIKRLAEDRQIDAARRLLAEVEALPGKTVFERRIAAARRSATATHPVAQARLDRVFEKTSKVLSGALDPRETRDLAILVDRAKQDAELRPDGSSEGDAGSARSAEPAPGGQ